MNKKIDFNLAIIIIFSTYEIRTHFVTQFPFPSTGLFIFCWLPFFTLYLLNPFCNNCINPILFSIAFWIGYLNSAINPIIYGALSKDFRFAFKRIICKFFCSGEGLRQPSSRRGSDMSAFRHGTGTRTPSISPSVIAQSICEDSDHIQDSSEPIR